MAYNGLGSDVNSNYFSFLARKPNEGKMPDVSEMILGSEHIYVIDSRQRDFVLYPNPAEYVVKIGTPFKNVTSLELKGSLIPKTEKNVNSENRNIPFNVEDFITSGTIKNSGYGYINGVYGFGAVAPNDTKVSLSPPAISGGIQAEITVTVVNHSIDNILIENPGSGYLRGYYGNSDYPEYGLYQNFGVDFINNIPKDRSLYSRWKEAVVSFEIGHELIAKISPGQYDFANPNDLNVGLCAAVTFSLQKAIDDAIAEGTLNPVIGGPQNGLQYFPIGTTNTGSCFLSTSNINASHNDRVNIQRGKPDNTYNQSAFLELLFGTSSCKSSTAINLLGYGSTITPVGLSPMDQTSFSVDTLTNITWESISIRGKNDWNLTDSPKYVILEITPLQESRIQSENTQLAKGFATLAFDANLPDVVFSSPSSNTVQGTGACGYTSLLAKPGILKGIKGQDFDSKILHFGPSPVAKLSELFIQFKKFNGDLYDFQGQDHLLIFNIGANDINSGNRF